MAADTSRKKFVTSSVLFVTWIAFYALRKSLVFTKVYMQNDWAYSKQDLGTIVSAFFFGYAIGKFASGLLVDHVNPVRLHLMALFASSCITIVFPYLNVSFVSVLLVFSLGLTSGPGWATIAKILGQLYEPKEKGSVWSLISLGSNLISAALPFLINLLATSFIWWFTFPIIGLISLALTVFGMFSLSLPEQSASVSVKSEIMPLMHVVSVVLRSRVLWCVCGYSFALNIIRSCITEWSLVYFTEHVNQGASLAAATAGIYQVGGIVGSAFAGFQSDWLIRKGWYPRGCPRSPLLITFALVNVLLIWLYGSLSYTTSQHWSLSLCFVLGFVMEGGSTMSGMTAIETTDKRFSGTAHAFSSLSSQMGSLLAGLPFGILLNNLGWTGAYHAVIFPAGLMLVLISVAPLLKSETKVE